MNSIDRDPTQEGILYVPSGHMRPLSDTFYRNAIASGSIIPPEGESANVRRSNFMVGICVLCFVVAGVVAFGIGMLWR